MATLAIVESPWWFMVLVYAEIVFVAGFFVYESSSLIFRRQVRRIERATHALAPERYFARFALPMITAMAAACISIGTGLVIGDDAVGGYLGLLMIVVFLVMPGRYLFNHATGSYPRPVPRARLRRVLAAATERLDSAVQIAPAEAARLHARLDRMGRVGDRMIRQAAEGGWRQAIRSDHGWLVITITLAALLPLVGAVRVTTRLARWELDTEALLFLGALLALSALAIAGVIMRRVRHRRNLSDLGAELRADSSTLLARLAEVTTIQTPRSSSAPASTLRLLWKRLVRSRQG